MEENNYENKHEHRADDCFMCKHPAMKHIFIGILTFLGAFAAFYVVTDWHFKRMFDPMVQMRKMDRAIMKEARMAERIARKDAIKADLLENQASHIINIDKTEDAYKIIINLKPFDNDEKNVEVTTEGNKMTITAAGETKKHNKSAIIRFTQSFIFPDNAIIGEMTKFKDGNKYVIVVPLED